MTGIPLGLQSSFNDHRSQVGEMSCPREVSLCGRQSFKPASLLQFETSKSPCRYVSIPQSSLWQSFTPQDNSEKTSGAAASQILAIQFEMHLNLLPPASMDVPDRMHPTASITSLAFKFLIVQTMDPWKDTAPLID